MMENDVNFYSDAVYLSGNKRRINIRPLIVILLVLIAIGIIVTVVFKLRFKDDYKYSLDVSVPSVVYVGNDVNLHVNIAGDEKYKDRLSTSLYLGDSESDIISLSDYEFYGDTGDITIEPLIKGSDTITVITTVDSLHDEGSTVVDEQNFPIIVCPSFNSALLSINKIDIKLHESFNVHEKFIDVKCAEGVNYVSSDSSILAVDGLGVITGIKKGTTNLILSQDNKRFMLKVTVH